MPANPRVGLLVAAGLIPAMVLWAPGPGVAHPLGNFSISHYAGIRVDQTAIEIRYFIDMAEIPTFQEIQERGIVPEAGHPSLAAYLPRATEVLRERLLVEVNGQRLILRGEGAGVIFPPGAGGLPTMKIGVVYRAPLDPAGSGARNIVRYQDRNFEGRAGWKEIIALAGSGVALEESSVPQQDRSGELSDYPTDLLNSPPQALEARLVFVSSGPPTTVAVIPSASSDPPAPSAQPAPIRPRETKALARNPTVTTPDPVRRPDAQSPLLEVEPMPRPTMAPIPLQPNLQATPRSSVTEIATARELRVGIVLIALVVAVGLGAVHALEPGHGKTVVAAYLVGSRGTAWHAFVLGLIVTASHTAGVYLLGGVTLYASRYVLPERLYPWLGVLSGLTIAGLGVLLFVRRYAGGHPHSDTHGDGHAHGSHPHAHDHGHGTRSHHHHPGGAAVSARELFALGVSGGIVPCPAALVVLLSALSLGRLALGLFLILAFSLGLAAVLIVIGILMVHARRLMSRVHGDGPLISRWLPLASSAAVTVFGVVIAVQALMAAGILDRRL